MSAWKSTQNARVPADSCWLEQRCFIIICLGKLLYNQTQVNMACLAPFWTPGTFERHQRHPHLTACNSSINKIGSSTFYCKKKRGQDTAERKRSPRSSCCLVHMTWAHACFKWFCITQWKHDAHYIMMTKLPEIIPVNTQNNIWKHLEIHWNDLELIHGCVFIMPKKSVNIWRQLIIVHHIPARSKLNENQNLLANSNPSHFRLKISSWSNSTPATNPSHPFVPENGYVFFTANALLDNVDCCCMRLCYSQLIDIQLKNVLATQWHHTQHGTIGCREKRPQNATKRNEITWHVHIFLGFCLIYLDISVVKHSCDRINQAFFAAFLATLSRHWVSTSFSA